MLQIIKSQWDAYEVAQHIMVHGGEFNTYKFEIVGDKVRATNCGEKLYINGEIHPYQIFPTSCELALILLWPERKQINDAIRSRK